eukprot:gene15853-21980_t
MRHRQDSNVEHGWNDKAKGAISSAFNVGHMVTNLYGGFLAAYMSPKLVLMWGALVWSLFTLLTPVAVDLSCFPLLLFVRAAMGLGEGVAFPVMQVRLAFGLVTFHSSGPHGSEPDGMLLLLLERAEMGLGEGVGNCPRLFPSEVAARAPRLISVGKSLSSFDAMGVGALFYVYGALGFLWAAGWDPLVPSHPSVSAPHAFDSDPPCALPLAFPSPPVSAPQGMQIQEEVLKEALILRMQVEGAWTLCMQVEGGIDSLHAG